MQSLGSARREPQQLNRGQMLHGKIYLQHTSGDSFHIAGIKGTRKFLNPYSRLTLKSSPSPLGTSPYALLGQPWIDDLNHFATEVSEPLFPRLKRLQDLRCASWKCFLTFSNSTQLIYPNTSLFSKELEMARSKHGVAELHLLSLPANVTEHRCFPVTLFIYSDAENWDVSRYPEYLP